MTQTTNQTSDLKNRVRLHVIFNDQKIINRLTFTGILNIAEKMFPIEVIRTDTGTYYAECENCYFTTFLGETVGEVVNYFGNILRNSNYFIAEAFALLVGDSDDILKLLRHQIDKEPQKYLQSTQSEITEYLDNVLGNSGVFLDKNDCGLYESYLTSVARQKLDAMTVKYQQGERAGWYSYQIGVQVWMGETRDAALKFIAELSGNPATILSQLMLMGGNGLTEKQTRSFSECEC